MLINNASAVVGFRRAAVAFFCVFFLCETKSGLDRGEHRSRESKCRPAYFVAAGFYSKKMGILFFLTLIHPGRVQCNDCGEAISSCKRQTKNARPFIRQRLL